MKIAMAQLDPIIGDFAGNTANIGKVMSECGGERPDLVVFPELFLCGYPPLDLLERQWFIGQCEQAVASVLDLSLRYPGTGILFGVPRRSAQLGGKGLHNSALLVQAGRVIFAQDKSLLPTYDVFDEARYFDRAAEIAVVRFRSETLGISICEDAWNDSELWMPRPYDVDPIEKLVAAGATVLVNLSASPFWLGKEAIRFSVLSNHARKHGVPLVFVNQVGANDELIFDGRSLALDRQGRPALVFPGFVEHVATFDTEESGETVDYQPQGAIESVRDALVLGIRDYARKTGFRRAVLGLSGGIDSAVTCALAVAALGAENVVGVAMPSEYSSEGSIEDARRLSENLDIRFSVIPIRDIHHAYIKTLAPEFEGREPDVTEENIQARVRGNLLMALSNKFGYLVLTTGNKSELAVGYCTLYGDMSGGLAVIADVPKTMVYELARLLNRGGREVVPLATIDKPPSAELRPNQTDQDTLPPYSVLDGILHLYIDEGESVDDIVERGYDREVAAWVLRTVDRNEYKRRQAAPGLKVTSKAFGMGRRMPIAARYRA